MAAPFVSGAVALLRSYRPQATIDAVKRALLNSVDLGNYPVKTQGRLNIRKALSQL
jgi:subtilisin family serine protease